MKRSLLLILLLLPTMVLARPIDLMLAYEDAIHYDPALQTARARLKAAREANPQAWANIFPSLSFDSDWRLTDLYNPPKGAVSSGGITGFSRDHSLVLTQSLINVEAWYGVSRANASIKSALATYEAARQDLMIRVAKSYLSILQAYDDLRFTISEKKANARQLDQAKQRFEVGLEAITSVYDAQASYDAVLSREIEAKNNIQNTKESLRAITGKYYGKFKKLKKHLTLLNPSPNHSDDWVSKGMTKNFTLIAAKNTAKAAKENVNVANAGHYPRLNAVGNYSNNSRQSFSFPRINTESLAGALQLSLPLISGGQLLSKARQAAAEYSASVAELDRAKRNVVSVTKQSFNNVVSGASKVKAGRQAIKSANSSLESTEAALKVGTRTIVDLLNAQRDLYQSQRRLAADQYQYINDTLSLKQASGVLVPSDILLVNGWLR